MKKQPKVMFKIEEPCHEKWSAMTPVQGGRFCYQCDKRVVDVSKLSDRELVKFYKTASKSTCARFRTDQLDRAIPLEAFKSSALSQKVAVPALAALLSFSTQVAAQESKPMIRGKVKTETQFCGTQTTSKKVEAKGVIQDAETGEPLIGCSVLVEGLTTGTVTDWEGRFTLGELAEQDMLIVSYVGYETQELSVRVFLETPVVKLRAQVTELGEIVVTAPVFPDALTYHYAGAVAAIVEGKPKKPKVELEPIVLTDVIYPNPFVDQFTLELDIQQADHYLLNIYAQDGKLVFANPYALEIGHQVIAVNTLPQALSAGNYVLQLVRSDEVVLTRKVVKE